MIYAVLVNEENADEFVHAVEFSVRKSCGIYLGAVDEETDTACGIIAVEMIEDDKGDVLAIRDIVVAEGYRHQGAGTAMVNALMELADYMGVKKVICSHMSDLKDEDALSGLLEKCEFNRIKKSIPVYSFKLEDMAVHPDKDELETRPLGEISDQDWKGIITIAKKRKAILGSRLFFDKKYSLAGYNGMGKVICAMLVSKRGDDVYIDNIIMADNKDDRTLKTLINRTSFNMAMELDSGTEVKVIAAGDVSEDQIFKLVKKEPDAAGQYVLHTRKL